MTVARLASDAKHLPALGAEPLQALVRLNSSATGDRYSSGPAFWALSSTVVGWLKSRNIPAALAAFGLGSSACSAVCMFAYIIDPPSPAS